MTIDTDSAMRGILVDRLARLISPRSA